MSEIELEIQAAQDRVDSFRPTLDLPASQLVAAAAEWARSEWRRIAEATVAANPGLVKENAEELGQLKAELNRLQSESVEEASKFLEPWLLHASSTDEELAGRASDRSWMWRAKENAERVDNSNDDPLRRLVGAIGPPLAKAGLLTKDAEVDRGGRYRYGLRDHTKVARAYFAYMNQLAALVELLGEHRALLHRQDVAQAKQLWNDS